MSSVVKTGSILALAAGCLMMTGCQPEPKASGEAVLETVEVQGISFNDPVPASGAAQAVAGSTEAAIAPIESPEDVSLTVGEEPPPLDIAAIPSATPVPQVAEAATEEVAVEATSHEAEDAPAVADAAPAVDPGEFVPLSFKVLSSFKYVEPIPNEGEKPEDVEKRRQTDQIPPEIKALSGKNAVLEGWMVPMEVAEDGSVKSFVLVNTQPQCCFGDMQAMNEWVDVVMKGKNAEFNVDMPMKVYGQLEVGEKMEDGFVLSIYRMKAERAEL